MIGFIQGKNHFIVKYVQQITEAKRTLEYTSKRPIQIEVKKGINVTFAIYILRLPQWKSLFSVKHVS